MRSPVRANVGADQPAASADHLHQRNKTVALGVPDELLRTKGAVCSEVARAMADGALKRSPADMSAAIRGVAGPSPDDDGNPVGFVCIARRGFSTIHIEKNYGNIGRDAVRERAMEDALAALSWAARWSHGAPHDVDEAIQRLIDQARTSLQNHHGQLQPRTE